MKIPLNPTVQDLKLQWNFFISFFLDIDQNTLKKNLNRNMGLLNFRPLEVPKLENAHFHFNAWKWMCVFGIS